MSGRVRIVTGLFLTVCLCLISQADGRPPIRKAFFNVYPSATGTRLDDLTSNPGHCGVCHFDFDGGGPRNAFGLQVQVAINSGNFATTEDAIMSLDGNDSDGDGYINSIEITDTNFVNTPTFPGLILGDTSSVSHVDIADIRDYLTPSGSLDTIPPVVTVLSPNGGENLNANVISQVTWSATDESGVSRIDIFLSDDGGTTYKPIAVGESNDGTFDWFVHNLPGGQSIIQVMARDGSGNYGSDESDGSFTITGRPPGAVPTTLRDVELPGTQPFGVGIFEDPDVSCITCHGDYNSAVEPHYNWKGSMMAQAMRDPLFLACLAVAEQDAPSVGDLCLRCHTPTGWLEGRSVDTGGGHLIERDFEGISCDFCHRLVDPDYKPGISPAKDEDILNNLAAVPPTTANGNYVIDPDPLRRGPYADADASHAFLESPFHRDCGLCGTCHDVSNPAFVAGGSPGDYVPQAFDTPHPDGDLRNMMPIERTYSEWTQTDYASTGVFAPQFAGDKPDGIVSSCQDCHMHDTTGKGCNVPGSPNRTDLPLHDLTGGNTFIADILPAMYPGEVDSLRLQAGKQRAIDMLQKAATMALATGQDNLNPTLTVTITNETAHKLPSGYPEGRRIWLDVRAYDDTDSLVYESGAYDASTGELSHVNDPKIYEIKLGISPALSPIIGIPAGESFHFVVNDTVLKDNRIPPRGFTNANFVTIQSPPVAYSYPDLQYWDDTYYVLPEGAVRAEVTLYYQTVSKEYIEFLRDENETNSIGDDLYNAWAASGKGPPIAMVSDTTSLFVDPSGVDDVPQLRTELFQNSPNPFNPTTTIRYTLDKRQHASIEIFDVAGRLVRTLVNETRPAGVQNVFWDGTNRRGQLVASGIYFYRLRTANAEITRRAVMLK